MYITKNIIFTVSKKFLIEIENACAGSILALKNLLTIRTLLKNGQNDNKTAEK